MTRRLMLWLGGATLLFWVCAAPIGALVMREEFDEVFDSALQRNAQRLMPLVIDDLFQRAHSHDPRRIGNLAPEHKEYFTYQVRDRVGRVLLPSHGALAQSFDDAPLRHGFWETATHCIYTEEVVSGTLFLQIADPLDHRREAAMEGALSLFVPILLLAPLSMAVIWVVIRRSLAPIEVLRQEIGARDGGNLSPIGMIGLPVELDTIAASVDRLLERLRTALDAEREFAANSAHELRTPIAGALAQTQRLVAELPQGAAKARARGIETSLSSLAHLVEKLLQLARAESGIGIADHAIDLVPTIRLVVDDFGRKPENAGRLILDIDGCATLIRKVDVDAFAIVLRNLIENALIHGLPDTPTTVSVRIDGTIAIANAGPGVPIPELQEVTKRFRRGATTIAAGSGLGLPIAAMLIQRMGASLELASPARGREDGFEAIIRISR
ncbi:two-component sensor histidine kinase [Mesorhizobium albiziae]|nr:two-component sensor histidine kinase [Mesorhizobium albiziae]